MCQYANVVIPKFKVIMADHYWHIGILSHYNIVSRYFYFVQYLADDFIHRSVRCLCFVSQSDAVA